MPWHVLIIKFTRPASSLSDLTELADFPPMGPIAEIRKAISTVFGDTSWADPGWGVWESEHGSIEFNIGEKDDPECLMLNVRASAAVIPRILDLCEANGWQAHDTGPAGVLTRDNHPERGLEAARAFTNRVIGWPPPDDD